MSTAGKVLAVLCVLMAVVGVILTASVDQLNVNANKRLSEIKTEIAKIETDLETTKVQASQLLAKTNDEQVGKDRDMRLVLARLSAAERQMSTTNESLMRVKIQLTNYQEAVKAAKLANEARAAERTKYRQDLATTQALVTRLQGENADKTGEVLQLRTEFQQVLKKNQADVEKELKAKKALTRSASYIP